MGEKGYGPTLAMVRYRVDERLIMRSMSTGGDGG
jgi:hypothetical protein